MNRMTDRCKNITLPQTSFAGGKNMLVDARYFSESCPVSFDVARLSDVVDLCQ